MTALPAATEVGRSRPAFGGSTDGLTTGDYGWLGRAPKCSWRRGAGGGRRRRMHQNTGCCRRWIPPSEACGTSVHGRRKAVDRAVIGLRRSVLTAEFAASSNPPLAVTCRQDRRGSLRQRLAVRGMMPGSRASAWLVNPSSASNTIGARRARSCTVVVGRS